jgi:hypothetical protein
MTSRFPAPWRIVEIPRGFAVEDATGQQLGVFYGRSDPNTAGHTGFLTMDEARRLAFDFAKLSELPERMSARSEVAEAAPRHAPQPCTSAQNGSRSRRQPEHLPSKLPLRSEILKPH